MHLNSPSRALLLTGIVGLGSVCFSGAVVGAQERPLRPVPVMRRPPPPQESRPQPQQANRPQQQQQQPQAKPQQPGASVSANPQAQARVAPIERREPNNAASATGGHLPEWMAAHSNLSPAQQQKALDSEPGFHDLPMVTQQRIKDRLAQLAAMTPEQRDRTIKRNEALEKLPPEQRAQWRGAQLQWGALPPDQKKAVAKSFGQLRQLPPDQRNAALASGRYTNGFNDAQRSTLSNLIRVEPWVPSGVGPGPVKSPPVLSAIPH